MPELYKDFQKINLNKLNFSKIKNGGDILEYQKIKSLNKDTKKVLEIILDNFKDKIDKNLNIEKIFENISKNLEKEENSIEKLLIAKTIQYEIEKFKNKLLKISNISKERAIQTDKLTGLNNRHFIEEFLLYKLNNKNIENNFSLILVDIDYFKKVNDNFGHNIGDLVLKDLAKIFKENIRGDDVVGRWGGEEFAIILNNIDENNSYNKIEKLREEIEKNLYNNVENYLENCLNNQTCKNAEQCNSKKKNFNCFKGKITCSFGLYNIDKEYIKNFDGNKVFLIEEMIDNADKSLYKSKQEGRNKVSIHKKNED